ncbi:MAG: site-2 protease family protein [Candidatus Woykebacteria bacterium]
MAVILAILIGIVILLFLVFIHEFGHFATAKFFGIKVEEFGFGFPPRIWGKKKGETIYSINAVPAGGFVRLLGEEEESNDLRSFTKKGPWVRAVVVAAGVIINFLLAVLIFYLILGFSGFKFDFDQTAIKTDFFFGKQQNSPVILDVAKDSPADKSGIKVGDKVISADGKLMESSRELQDFVGDNLGEEVTFTVQNIEEKDTRIVSLVPREKPPEGEGSVGVGLGIDLATVSYEGVEKVFAGFLHSANTLQFQAVAIGSLIKQSFEEKTPEPITENVAGPVGIVALIAQFVGIGGFAAVGALASLTALISLILAVVNILPIPALDGGRFFFILIEGLTGYKVNPRAERLIHGVAFIVLLALVVLVAFNDISKLLR